MGIRRTGLVLLATVAALPLAGVGIVFTAAPAIAGVTNYTDSTIASPMDITRGPDGALWFGSGNSIGRISTSGVVTNFTDPSISGVYGITTGPDGALWFTNHSSNSIGRITTAGVVTNYTDITISSPYGITSGPDNALWFTNGGASIERITTAGVVTQFADIHNIDNPHGIAYDGNFLWFTNWHGNSIGRAYRGGGDDLVVSSYKDSSIVGPEDVAVGPDGNVWYTNLNGNAIGRITRIGSITNYPSATISLPAGIAAGPDGALWFTNTGNNSIGRITTGGVVTNYPDSTINYPNRIVTGPDGALWFVNTVGNSIGRITTAPGAVTASAAQQGSGAAKVSWKAPVLNGGAAVTSYVVTPYLGNAKQPARTFPATATNAVLKGLKNGKKYQFTVVAKNAAGTSAGAKTPAIVVGAPSAPGKPTVKRVKLGSLKVTWKAGAANGAPITGYVVTCTSANRGTTGSKSGTKSPVTVTKLTGARPTRVASRARTVEVWVRLRPRQAQ